MKTFADYSLATQMRDVITQIATKVIEDLRPRDVFAKVVTIDAANARCEVQFRGEPDTVFVPMGTIRPSVVGQRVRISGPKGDRFISDVVSLAGGTTTGSSSGTTTTTSSTTPIIPYVRTGALTVVSGVTRFRWPISATLVGVSLAVNTAPTGASIIVDVNKNGTSVFTNANSRPIITASSFASTTEASPDNFSMVQGDYMTVDIDQVGSTIAGSDLTVLVRYRQS